MNMLTLRFHIFLILILIFSMGLWAGETGGASPGDDERMSDRTEARQIAAEEKTEGIVIREIRFHGLKRTGEKTIRKIIRPVAEGGIFIPADVADVAEGGQGGGGSEELIIQELREADIFNPEIRVESRIEGDEAFIDVYVRDKWTLIPIPFFAFSKDGSWSGGLMGIESNLFGLGKTLGAGLFFGSFGWSGLGFYSDPLFMGSDMTLHASVSGGINDADTLDPDEDVIRSYRENALRLGLGLTYPFSERFSVRGDGRFNYSDILSGESEGLEDGQALGFRGRVQWKDLYYDIPYQYGLYARLEGQANAALNGDDPYHSLKTEIFRAFNPMMRHQLKFAVKGGWGFGVPVQEQFSLGGGHGSFTLPGDQRAEHYALGYLSYGLPLWSFSWGTLTARALYEAGWYESDLLERVFYHGPGAGIELYLNDLAVPAFMLTFGWNLETGRYQIAAGVGVGRD